MPLDLPPRAFAKQDVTSDLDFYAPPRLVHHIDDKAVTALTAYYRTLIPAGSDVLDLMSSWVSHLPPELPLGAVIGHGMNATELAANPSLTRFFVQDLNVDPHLQLASASIDVALCCVGAQYLQRPVEVFADVARVLRPGGAVAVSFSNRCFPTKAVAIWRALDLGGQARLIVAYLQEAGFVTIETQVLDDGVRSDPLVVVTGRTASAAAP